VVIVMIKPINTNIVYKFKNNTEKRYAQQLELLRKSGNISSWTYECIKFKLGNGAWYTPDFVVTKEDVMEIHEIKGHWKEAAKVRIKVASTLYPQFRWMAVYWKKKRWIYEEF